MTDITILEIAAECEVAHTEFVDKLDQISKKYNIPRKIVYQLAMEVFQEVDINDNY